MSNQTENKTYQIIIEAKGSYLITVVADALNEARHPDNLSGVNEFLEKTWLMVNQLSEDYGDEDYKSEAHQLAIEVARLRDVHAVSSAFFDAMHPWRSDKTNAFLEKAHNAAQKVIKEMEWLEE